MKVHHEGWDKQHLTTAWFIGVIRQWFELITSRQFSLAISKNNIDEHNKTITFLHFVCNLFQTCKLGDWKPVQTAVILSTTSVLHLQEHLLVTNDRFLLTLRLIRDCLENLFSTVRLRSPIPSTLEFKRNLRNICVSQFLKVPENTSYDAHESILG